MISYADAARLKQSNESLIQRNAKLAELLKRSREQLAAMQEQLEQLDIPASPYGVFLGWSDPHAPGDSAEIVTQGRRLRVRVSPDVERLHRGQLVRLGVDDTVIEAAEFPRAGDIASVTELLDSQRALVVDAAGAQQVVWLTDHLTGRVRAGDNVLVETSSRSAIEALPAAEFAGLTLEEVPDVTWDDIGGLDSQIEAIRDAVELPFTQPDLYRAFQLHPPRGVLLYGPPGVGKTLIAKAIAHSLGGEDQPWFLNVKGPELLNKFVGETERRIRTIFERARELGAAGRQVVIFFDEIDSIFRTRGSGLSSDVETTVVPQLLAELDGVESLSNVLVIGATNREELIDPALLRPGRLDVKIHISRPDRDAARDILRRHLTPDLPLDEAYDELVEATVTALFADAPCAELTFADGHTRTVHYRDIISGAFIAAVVDRAKKKAIKRRISHDPQAGLSRDILRAAVAEEQTTSAGLVDTSNPQEWARLNGITSLATIGPAGQAEQKIIGVRPLGLRP